MPSYSTHAQTFNGNWPTKTYFTCSHRTNKNNQSILDTQKYGNKNKSESTKVEGQVYTDETYGIWNNADSSMSLGVSVQVVKFMRRPTEEYTLALAGAGAGYCYCCCWQCSSISL